MGCSLSCSGDAHQTAVRLLHLGSRGAQRAAMRSKTPSDSNSIEARVEWPTRMHACRSFRQFTIAAPTGPENAIITHDCQYFDITCLEVRNFVLHVDILMCLHVKRGWCVSVLFTCTRSHSSGLFCFF